MRLSRMFRFTAVSMALSTRRQLRIPIDGIRMSSLHSRSTESAVPFGTIRRRTLASWMHTWIQFVISWLKCCRNQSLAQGRANEFAGLKKIAKEIGVYLKYE